MHHPTVIRWGFPLLFAVAMQPAFAQDAGKISGYMFGDYYAVVANHDSALEDQNGLWFRRIYLTYDKPLSAEFSTRLRFEMASAGDFAAPSKLTPFVKDAYVKWSRSRHAILVGISPSPTWEELEGIWGYRSVEKTPLDLQKMGGSRDFGIAFQGAFDPKKRVSYHLMFGNGSDTGSETNKEKKLYLALTFVPAGGVTFQIYTDWEQRPGDTDRYVVQGFATYVRPEFRLGAHVAQQTRNIPNASDTRIEVISMFGAVRLAPQVSVLARFDRLFDPNPDGDRIAYIPFDKTAESNFFVGGFDITPVKSVHIIPNVETVLYSNAAGPDPGNDVIARLTFFYTF